MQLCNLKFWFDTKDVETVCESIPFSCVDSCSYYDNVCTLCFVQDHFSERNIDNVCILYCMRACCWFHVISGESLGNAAFKSPEEFMQHVCKQHVRSTLVTVLVLQQDRSKLKRLQLFRIL